MIIMTSTIWNKYYGNTTQAVLHTCICKNEYFSHPDYFRCGQTYGLRYELLD